MDECGLRLAAILKKVITSEINLRAADLAVAEQNIHTVRECLNRTRQGVCADFYDDSFKTTLQKPAHSAVKKTFAGKTPIKQEPEDTDYNSSSSRWSSASQSKSGKVDFENSETIKKEPPDSGCLKEENVDVEEDSQSKYLDPDGKLGVVSDMEKRRPRYIPPVIPVDQIQHSLKPRGNKTTRKVRFLIRNNSKYILTPEDSSGATHKWSLSVKLNDESVDISRIVSKVVFYLHSSYKPHDIVTINSPPFKITRRGWGEFDMCIKIFFTDDKNEPVALTHPLVFDKLHSGMETFGGETIFDHWIIEPSEPTHMISVDETPSSKGNEMNPVNRAEPSIISEASSLPTLSSTTFDDFSTMPFTNETSKHFLSAIFGEPEEISAAKKDWEQFDSIFNLDDLAFPEFFGPCTNEPKSNTVKSTGDDSQITLPELKPNSGNVTDGVMYDKSSLSRPVSADTSSLQNEGMSSSGDKVPGQLGSSAIVPVPVVGSTCDSPIPQPGGSSTLVSSEVVTTDVDCSLQNHVQNLSEKELYLSDLSEFGDEVIIMDSEDTTQSDMQSAVTDQMSNQEKDPVQCIDYSIMEMDDLIKFPSEKSNAQPQKVVLKSCDSSPVIRVAASKVPNPSSKKARLSSGAIKAFPQCGLKTDANLVSKPRSTLLVTSANVSSIMSNKSTDSTSRTLLVNSTNPPSIANTRPVTNYPPKLLVNASNLPSVTSSKSLPTSTTNDQKSNSKNGSHTVVKKIVASNLRNVDTVPAIARGGSLVNRPSTSRASLKGSLAVPLVGAVSSGNLASTTSSGQPVTLLSVVNTTSALMPVSKAAPVIISSAIMPVSKTAPIVISSPRVGNQATPTLLVPSSMILKQALNKTATNATTGQLNKIVLPQMISLAPKGNKLITNVTNTSPTQLRPGGTRFLVKMPDGTLKPINLETLTPLKPSELKRVNPVASGSRSQVLVPQPVLMRPPAISPVHSSAAQPTALIGIPPRGKRAAPAHTVPAKKRKPEPKLTPLTSGNVRAQRTPIILSAAPQVVFKLPPSPNQLLVVPQTVSSPVIHIPSQRGKKRLSNLTPALNEKAASPSTTAVRQNQTPAANPERLGTLNPRPEGMSILKRRPPESEVDARSLIQQCPSYSTEVSICWLLKKFPLVHSCAGEESFKQAFPYCAASIAQFNHWPLAKRRAHELLRANDVMRVVRQIYRTCDWKKLDVIKFARLRGFTPVRGKINPSAHIHQPPVLEDRCSVADTEEMTRMLASYQADTEDIDVTSIEEDQPRSNVQPTTQTKDVKGKTFMTLQGHLEDAQVVEQWVEADSIYPEPEEIEPGVMFPAVLRALVSTYHSIAEDLIRRSYSSSYLRHNSTEPRNVTLEDVQLALFSREEFDIFTKQGFGIRPTKGSVSALEIKKTL